MQNADHKNDYAQLTAALEQYSAASNELATIEAEFQSSLHDLVTTFYRDDFRENQAHQAEAEAKIETLVSRHPEWFAKTKTLKTPYGSVASRSTTKLDVPNEEATIALLELRGEAARPFLRERKYLSLEALEAMEDHELRMLKVNRVTTEKITISPVNVDLGKTVKSTEKTPTEAPRA